MHYCLRALFFVCFIFCVLYCLRALFFCALLYPCALLCVCALLLCDVRPLASDFAHIRFFYTALILLLLPFFCAYLFVCLNWIPSCIFYMQNFDVFSPLLSSHDKSIANVFIPRYFAKFLLFLGICCFIIPCCFASNFSLLFYFLWFFLFVMGVKSAILYVVNRRFSHILLRIYTRKISLNIFHFDSLEMKGKRRYFRISSTDVLDSVFFLVFFYLLKIYMGADVLYIKCHFSVLLLYDKIAHFYIPSFSFYLL